MFNKIKKSIILSILIVLFLFNSESFASDDQFIDIRIGKAHSLNDKISLSSKSGFILKNTDNDIVLDLDEIHITFVNSEFYIINDQNYNKIIELSFIDNYEILPKSNDFIQYNGIPYRGSFKIYNKSNAFYIINHISLGEYLYGVLPKEIPTSAPIEALKAQAIASRTYSLKNINKHITEGYNLCDTTHCQVYGGQRIENSNTNTAVDLTKNYVIYYNDSIIDAVFHSSSGGHTESSYNVWGNRVPYLVATPDPFSFNSPNSNWNITFSSAVIENSLRNNGININSLVDIEILDRTESGRVKTIKIVSSDKTTLLSGEKFRSIMGNSNFKSTLFDIQKNQDFDTNQYSLITESGRTNINFGFGKIFTLTDKGLKQVSNPSIKVLDTNGVRDLTTNNKVYSFTFTGKGYGHGVGMSQYGAIEMAKQGYSSEEILQFYYKDVTISK